MVSPVDEDICHQISPGKLPSLLSSNQAQEAPYGSTPGGPTWEEHEEEGRDRSGLFQGQFHVKGRLLDEILRVDPLVGGWTNSFEKYASQNGSKWEVSPIFGVKIKKFWNHQPVPFLSGFFWFAFGL